jgi:hypothetical protein
VDYRDYGVMWSENGREMRMDITFRSDDTDYWVSEWKVYDGRKDPGWAVFTGPRFVTPLDEPMEADDVASQTPGPFPTAAARRS